MDENDKVRKPQEQADKTRRQWELSYGHRHQDWPDPLREPYEPTQDELDLLHSQVPGHHWDAWRRLTGDEDYFAACSCGWRSPDTSHVSPTLRQAKDHLDTVRALRGWRPAPSTAQAPRRNKQQAPRRDEQERDVGQDQMRAAEHLRELYASIESQQEHLAQTVEHFSNVLATNAELAEHRVTELEREVARVEQGRGQTTAAALRAEALKRRLERATKQRDGMASASAAMAVVAEEIAWIHQDLETRHSSGNR